MDVDGCIVVGVDGSSDGSGLRWAAEEADRRHTGLIVAYGGGHPMQVALSAATRRAAETEIREFGEAVVRAGEMAVRADFPGLEVRTHVSTVATRWPLGSVAERVAGHARCPVAVIKREDHGVHANLIVAGIGSRADGEQVLRYACAEARARNAGVLAVHAWGAAELIAAAGLGYVGANLKDLEHDSQAGLQSLIDSVARDFGDVPIGMRLIQSNAAFAVAQAAEHASVLVIGAGYADDANHSHLSRVASVAMHRCDCPVIVVGRVSADATASTADAAG
jgi:nucleotide-binding universal stress UspA family protein